MRVNGCIHRRFIYSEHTSTHAQGADPRVWRLARAGLSADARSPAISRIRGRGRPYHVVALECEQSEVDVLGLE